MSCWNVTTVDPVVFLQSSTPRIDPGVNNNIVAIAVAVPVSVVVVGAILVAIFLFWKKRYPQKLDQIENHMEVTTYSDTLLSESNDTNASNYKTLSPSELDDKTKQGIVMFYNLIDTFRVCTFPFSTVADFIYRYSFAT